MKKKEKNTILAQKPRYHIHMNTPAQTTDLPLDHTRDRAEATIMTQVACWMMLGLLVTAGVAAYFGASQNMVDYFEQHPGVMWGAIIGQLVLVFVLVLGLRKMPLPVAQMMFLVYAALNGFVLSSLAAVYTTATLGYTFLITAVMFGGLALFGATTKKNLSAVGRFAFMALLGLIVAMLVSFFVHSSALQMAINVAGVIIFAALTAYDTQKINNISREMSGADQQTKGRAAIYGALALYLDFINMFLFLLRLFGSSR